MSLMKYAVVVILAAIVTTIAEETKSTLNNSQLTSSNDIKQAPNKRLAIYGSPNALNSGFKPIAPSYSSDNNYVGNPQLYPSAASNVYTKTPYNPSSYNPYVSASNIVQYQGPQQSYSQYQPLTYGAASQPAYLQPPSNYAYSSFALGPQMFPQQIPYNHYAYNPVQPIQPVLHAAPVATFANSYQAPANAFYVNPQQFHKPAIYNQQPQTFNTQSYQPSNYNYHSKQVSPSPPSQIVTSKPVALETPIGPTPTSHVDHSHGAISYAHFSNSHGRKPSPAPLIATQTPQQAYYHHHQQPQTFYMGDYNKPIQYASIPIASSYYTAQGSGVHYGNFPYAHMSKDSFASPTASTIIPSIAAFPQRVAFH